MKQLNEFWTRIPVGWYAIHAGAQQINEERAERIRAVWPTAPAEETLPHSAILGDLARDAVRSVKRIDTVAI